MKLLEIFETWSNDCDLDVSKLDTESIKIPSLHSKYLIFYSREKIKLKKLLLDRKVLIKDLHEYYSNTLDIEDLKLLGLEPLQIRIIKGDINTYIDANKLMVKLNTEIIIQEEKVEALNSIIKNINNRGFQIKSAIDFLRFSNGY